MSRPSRKNLALSMFLSLFLGAAAQAATVYLKDGSVVKGTVVSATAQEVQINNDTGLVHVAADRIQRIEYADTQTPPPAPQPPAAEAPPVPTGPPPEPMETRRWRHRGYRQPRESIPDPSDADQEFSIILGGATPLTRVDFSAAGGGTDDNGDTGSQVGFQYLVHSTPQLAWGLNLEWLTRDLPATGALLPQALTRVSGQSLLLMPVMKYSFLNHGWARPYVLAGVGANRTSTVIESQPDFGFAWGDTMTDETRTMVDGTRWGLATTARLGIDFLLFDPGFFSFELGWTGISNKSIGAAPAGRDQGLDTVTGRLSFMTIGGRWGWRF